MESFLRAGKLQRLHLFLNLEVVHYWKTRPISVLLIVSILLEKAAQQALKDYFELENLLSKRQHGFRKKHSTKTASIYFCDSIRKQINNGKLTGAVYVDLSKAFETIGRSVPLQKLSVYVVMYADDTVLYVSHESKREN